LQEKGAGQSKESAHENRLSHEIPPLSLRYQHHGRSEFLLRIHLAE
jgi:hypothetical protein